MLLAIKKNVKKSKDIHNKGLKEILFGFKDTICQINYRILHNLIC